MKKLLLIYFLWLSAMIAQAQTFPPLFVPRLNESEVPNSPTTTGENVFISNRDGKLKAKNNAGDLREMAVSVAKDTIVAPILFAIVDRVYLMSNFVLLQSAAPVQIRIDQDNWIDASEFGSAMEGQSYNQRVVVRVPMGVHTIQVRVKGKTESVSIAVTVSSNVSTQIFPAKVVKPVDPVQDSDKPTDNNHSVITKPVSGEIKALVINGLQDIPTFSLPRGAVNLLSTDVSFDIQADWARRGMVNYVHVTKLVDERGGQYHKDWNPKGLTGEQWKQALAEYKLPSHIGIYRMLYDNAAPGWPLGQSAPNSQKELNDVVLGYGRGLHELLGWESHPKLLDIDFEDGRFFTYAGVKAQAQAISYALKNQPDLKIQVYAGAHNNLSHDAGGNANNPDRQISSSMRFEMLKAAGMNVTSATLPYFHLPSYHWNDPSYEPSVIGPGKMYRNHQEFADLSLWPIKAKLDWTDKYFQTIPANWNPVNVEWMMSIYEGGDNGKERHYDQQGNWISSLNWPEIGHWVSESLPVWGCVTGSYRYGGGLYNWMDGRTRQRGQDYIEAGKWRAYQFNRFWNNPATLYNIEVEFSMDNGRTWTKGNPNIGNLVEEANSTIPYLRGAFAEHELLVVGTAGQIHHIKDTPESIKIRYAGNEFDLALQPRTVHSIVYSIQAK